MTNNEWERELVPRTWMAFRGRSAGTRLSHNVDMTFEMLQVMNCLWNKQGEHNPWLKQQRTRLA